MNHAVFSSTGPLARALVFGVALGLGSVAALADDAKPAHWSYKGETGPDHWGSEDAAYAVCGLGKHQSPINIDHTVKKDLPALKFDYKDTPLKVTDTGHSFQVNAATGVGGFDVGAEHYDLVQLHFHEPSEETIHGQHAAAVAHIVHKNAKGELAVVAVLIHVGQHANAFLKSIFDNFPPAGTAETVVDGKTLNVGSFLPKTQGYYTFEGSLTTPPCSENVRWFVLKTPVYASAAQLKQFGARYAHNNRPTQPLNGREIDETK